MKLFLKSAALFFSLVLLAFAVSALTGCGTPQRYTFHDAGNTNGAAGDGSTPVSVSPTGAPRAAASSANLSPDLLRAGDNIIITFSGIPNPPPEHKEKIREDGYINPPYLGPVMAAGKTVGKLQEELQKMYVPAYFTRALTVTVTIEGRFFYVGGEVKSPNRYVYSGEMNVLKAIQTAGDFTPFANRKKVQVTRANGKVETVNCDRALKNPKLNLSIFPGDQVNVPQRWY